MPYFVLLSRSSKSLIDYLNQTYGGQPVKYTIRTSRCQYMYMKIYRDEIQIGTN